MRLDKTLEGQPLRNLWVILAGVAFLVLLSFRPLRDWRAGAMVTCLTALDYVTARQRHRGGWLLLDAAFITGAFVFDHLSHQRSPVVSPFVFMAVFVLVAGAMSLLRYARTARP